MKILVRVLIVVVALGAFLYLFVRSARNVRSEAFVVPAAHVAPWTLTTGTGGQPGSPVLILRPPQELAGNLFSQVFSRMMESLKGSVGGGIPIVLRSELDGPLGGRYTPSTLLEAARAAGLESARPEPVCVAMRRVSEPGLTRQVYFVIFDAPAIQAFRRQLAADAPAQADAFDPPALSPVMIIAGSDDRFESWLPIVADADEECIAPVVVE